MGGDFGHLENPRTMAGEIEEVGEKRGGNKNPKFHNARNLNLQGDVN